MKYTNTFEELMEYLDAQMEKYLERRSLSRDEEMMTIARYEEEKEILELQVKKFPETVREMWFLAFLGQMAKEKGVVIRNRMNQCPFLMHLLKVASYNVLEEGYGEKSYLYKKTNIDATYFYVEADFYEKTKGCIQKFFEKTGHVVLWVGYSDICSDYPIDRQPEGIVVFPAQTDIVELRNECGELYDGNACILAEYAPDMYDKGTWYEFIPMQRERQSMIEEERTILKAYQSNQVDKKEVIKILAVGLIDGFNKTVHSYYGGMELFKYNIYSREDLLEYLIDNGLEEERAYYWTEVIRKGTLGWRIEKHNLSYDDYTELYWTIGKERISLFSGIYYLPTRWSILERFYWLQEQKETNKIIAVDFDGTLSLGEWPSIGTANEELIEYLKERKKNGDKLILWTCREGGALEDAVNWCAKQGLVFDAVNDNVSEMIELYGTNSRKVSCDYYIDDKAVMTNAFGLLK